MVTLKELREQKELTQTEVAREMGISLGGYRLWELGAGKPRKENLEKLALVLGKDVYSTFGV